MGQSIHVHFQVFPWAFRVWMMQDYRCLEITVLKKPRSEEARQLMDKVAKQVQPIMRKRQWTVKRVGKAQHNARQLQLQFWAITANPQRDIAFDACG
jgi:hypothetical protein